MPSSDVSGALSPREREVARLVAQGLANKEIARELGLSHGTVKLHVHSIFLKLNAKTPFRPGTRKRYVLVQLMRSA
jgi:DNA-binding NarL/FixJ family response regulator